MTFLYIISIVLIIFSAVILTILGENTTLKKPVHFILGIILVFFLLYAGSNANKIKNLREQSKIEKTIQKEDIADNVLLEDSVKLFIEGMRISYPDIVMKQAKIESGNFTSAIFKDNNNMFGMKYPRKRPTIAIGENRGYAVYESWQHSIIDYAFWQLYTAKHIKSLPEYLDHLDSQYAEDSLYKDKLKR